MKNNAYDVALIAPPWWLIPSEDVNTATEYLVQEYGFYLKKNGYHPVIFSREKDFTDEKDVFDAYQYQNDYGYYPVCEDDRERLREIANAHDEFGYSNSLLFYYSYIMKIARAIKAMGIQKIIVYQTFTFCYWLKYVIPEAEIIYHIGNHELGKNQTYFGYFNIQDALANEVLPKIHRVVCVSDAIKNAIVERFPEHAEKITTIYPGIDGKLFRFQKKEAHKIPILTFNGRVVYEKGVDILIRAVILLEQQGIPLCLRIIGSPLGPNDNEAYLEEIHTLSQGHNIEFLGFVPRRQLVDYLHQTTLFIYPALWDEPLGLAPLEAMSTGTPTIVSHNNAGYMEIIKHGINGFAYSGNQPEKLADAIRDVIHQPALLEEVGAKARSTAEKVLDWNTCVHDTMALFRR